MQPVGDVQVVERNERTLILRGFVVLQKTIGSVVFWYEYGIVRELPIDVIISGDVLIPHQCTLQYTSNQEKQLEFGHQDCSKCAVNQANKESGTKVQFKFTVRQSINNKEN